MSNENFADTGRDYPGGEAHLDNLIGKESEEHLVSPCSLDFFKYCFQQSFTEQLWNLTWSDVVNLLLCSAAKMRIASLHSLKMYTI